MEIITAAPKAVSTPWAPLPPGAGGSGAASAPRTEPRPRPSSLGRALARLGEPASYARGMAWLSGLKAMLLSFGLLGLCSGKDKSPRSVSLRLAFVREGSLWWEVCWGLGERPPGKLGVPGRLNWEKDLLEVMRRREGNLGSGGGEGVGTERKEGISLGFLGWQEGETLIAAELLFDFQ